MRSKARSARRSRTALHKAMNTLTPAVSNKTPAKARSTSAPMPISPSKRETSSAGDAACMSVVVLMKRGKVTAASGLRY